MTTHGAVASDRLSHNARHRSELAAVLASDLFKRLPKLSRLLRYLCERCSEGLAQEITEYGIGFDVLGRDASFDTQRDALVRVHAHNLRKRLEQYYACEGRDHDLRIVLTKGQYVPQFLTKEQLPSNRPTAKAAAETGAPLFSAGSWPSAIGHEIAEQRIAAPLPAMPRTADGEDVVMRIAAGDRQRDYTDTFGRIWMSDRFFRGGAPFCRRPPIQHTLNAELFWKGREGEFAYDIPLNPGVYELHLYFAETDSAATADHRVRVALNGVPIRAMDIACDAGCANTATVKILSHISPANDGMLHLTFLERSFLNALEVFPSAASKMRPIRITTRDCVYCDDVGQTWMPDECSAGGHRALCVAAQVEGSVDSGLYQSYRFGHFNYSIPVVEGIRCAVKLHFSEPLFTQSSPGGGIGRRVFNVYSYGTTLLKAFDIVREVGDRNRGLIRTFHGIPATPEGKIELTFVPMVNDALVNAIEVVEE